MKITRKKICLCTVAFMLLITVSCKKGENDPAFTLLSRKARLEGNWKMKEGSLTVGIKDSTGAYGGIVYKLQADKYDLTFPGNGGRFDGPCKLNISFTKDGLVKLEQQMDSVSITASGTWDFQGKVGKAKNKERITVQLSQLTGYSNRLDLFNKSVYTFTYRIKELRNKMLVLAADEEMIEIYKNGVGYYVTSEYTFVQ